ncbi:MAG: hypothetical protein ACK4HE_06160 [Chitinophagaceae bacterium]
MLVWLALVCYNNTLLAQDSIIQKQTCWQRWKQSAIKSIYTNNPVEKVVAAVASEHPAQKHTGKFIRHIFFSQVPYGGSIFDTIKRSNALQRMIDEIHINTRKDALRSFLFLKKGDVLDVYALQDNERLLRDLPFIQDAKIETFTTIYPDSVDLIITTKDVFSIGGDVRRISKNFAAANLYDQNFLGRAQRLQFGFLYDEKRTPTLAGEMSYTKYNIANTFIALQLRHAATANSTLLGGLYDRVTEINANRGLYTTKATWAGGFRLAQHTSVGNGRAADTLSYKYTTGDVWYGVNLGARKKQYNDSSYRNSKFIALRYFERRFVYLPNVQNNKFPQTFYNQQQLLAEFSLFNINFRRSNFIYGFGRTEDIPYGLNHRFTVGVNNYQHVKRFYIGVDVQKIMLMQSGAFTSIRLAAGANKSEQQWEDNTFFTDVSYTSKLITRHNCYMRNIISANIAFISNRTQLLPLNINNPYGIQDLRSDTILGNKRIKLEAQNLLFTKWNLFGFNIGFVNFIEWSLIAEESKQVFGGDGFGALGTGLRVRNEALVFGTIEAKLRWFPRVVTGNAFSFTLTSNLQVRYSGAFVRAPQTAYLQ